MNPATGDIAPAPAVVEDLGQQLNALDLASAASSTPAPLRALATTSPSGSPQRQVAPGDPSSYVQSSNVSKDAPDQGFVKLLDRCHLFVGDLHRTTTEEDLQEAFRPYGAIVFSEVKRDKVSGRNLGYGFLKLDTEEGADRAMREMNGVSLKGRRIRVNYAQKNCELLVTNMSESVTRDELLAIFATHGPLDVDHCVVRPPDAAVVTAGGKLGASAIIKFRYRQHAENARDTINHRVLLNGNPLRVDWHVKDNKRFRFKTLPPGPYPLDAMGAINPALLDPKMALRQWPRAPMPYAAPFPLQLRVTIIGRGALEVKRGSLVVALKRIHEASPIGEVRQIFTPPNPAANGEYRRVFVADLHATQEGVEAMEIILREASQPAGLRLKGCRMICEPHFAGVSEPAAYALPSSPMGYFGHTGAGGSQGYPYLAHAFPADATPPASPAGQGGPTTMASVPPYLDPRGAFTAYPGMQMATHGHPYPPGHPVASPYGGHAGASSSPYAQTQSGHNVQAPRVPGGGGWELAYHPGAPVDYRNAGAGRVVGADTGSGEVREPHRADVNYGYVLQAPYGGAYMTPGVMGFYGGPSMDPAAMPVDPQAYMAMSSGAMGAASMGPGGLHPYYAMPYAASPGAYHMAHAPPGSAPVPDEAGPGDDGAIHAHTG